MSRYRDHLLFLGAGLMVGFVLAYLAFEHIGRQQPQARSAVRTTQGPAEAVPVPPEDAAAPQQAMSQAMARVEELTQRVQQNPEDAEALLELAGMNIQIGQWPRAADLLERRLALRPDEPDVLAYLGLSYRNLGEPEKALGVLEQALEINPDHLAALYYETMVLAMDLQRFDAAEENLDDLRRLQPGNPEIEALAEEIARRRDAA